MNKQLELVSEFQRAFQAPILEKPSIIDSKRFQLRINLIKEELEELEDAHEVQNKIEVLDALGDLQYVLNGIILELGFQYAFDEAFKRIHNSNMSKVCKTIEVAEQTVAQYKEKGIDTYYKSANGTFLVYRTADDKILKSKDYFPVQLKDLIE